MDTPTIENDTSIEVTPEMIFSVATELRMWFGSDEYLLDEATALVIANDICSVVFRGTHAPT